MTESLTILDNIRIASPCSAEWSAMSGDDRTRFCGSCQKHVYNLSTMTTEQAVQLIHEREGHLCCRLFRRADGTVLTSDCPVGARAVWRRTRQLAAACVAAVLIGIGGVLLPNVLEARSSSSSPTKGAVVQKTLALWDDLLVWMGVRQRFAIAGDICIGPPPTTTTSPVNAGSQGSP